MSCFVNSHVLIQKFFATHEPVRGPVRYPETRFSYAVAETGGRNWWQEPVRMLARGDRFERGDRSLNAEAAVEIDSMALMHDIST